MWSLRRLVPLQEYPFFAGIVHIWDGQSSGLVDITSHGTGNSQFRVSKVEDSQKELANTTIKQRIKSVCSCKRESQCWYFPTHPIRLQGCADNSVMREAIFSADRGATEELTRSQHQRLLCATYAVCSKNGDDDSL